MFIITGNNVSTHQVRILDTEDKVEEWVSYKTLSRGIKQGLDIRGMTPDNKNIMLHKTNIEASLQQQIPPIVAKCIALKNKLPLVQLFQPYGLINTEQDLSIRGNTVHLYNVSKVIKPNVELSVFDINIKAKNKANTDTKEIIDAIRDILQFYNIRKPLKLTHIVDLEDGDGYIALLDTMLVGAHIASIYEFFDENGDTELLSMSKEPVEPAYINYITQLSKKIKKKGFDTCCNDSFVYEIRFNEQVTSRSYFEDAIETNYSKYGECSISLIFGEPWHLMTPKDSYYDTKLYDLIQLSTQKYNAMKPLREKYNELQQYNLMEDKYRNEYASLTAELNRIQKLDRASFNKEFSNTEDLNKVTISCVCATYLDSDDTVNKVSIYVKHLEDKKEIIQLLEEQGNTGVEILEFEERIVTFAELERLEIGDVVEVYETTEEEEEEFEEWQNAGYSGYRTIITFEDGHTQIENFDNLAEAIQYFEGAYENASDEDFAENVLYHILSNLQAEEFDETADDGYAIIAVHE